MKCIKAECRRLL